MCVADMVVGWGGLLCRGKSGLYLIVAKFVAIRKVYRLV